MRTLIALLALALLLPHALAQGCVPTTSSPMVTLDGSAAGAPTLYAHEDCFGQPICGGIFSLWIYQESNGIAGLQRGDEIVDDTCDGEIASDTIVF